MWIMAKEKMKVCIFVTASTLKDQTSSLPEACRKKGCLGIFKIDEDPKCRLFMDKKELKIRHARAMRKIRQRDKAAKKDNV
jgi:hypothetical protein